MYYSFSLVFVDKCRYDRAVAVLFDRTASLIIYTTIITMLMENEGMWDID